MGRPPTGQTPVHSIRIPTTLWNEARDTTPDGNMNHLIHTLLTRHITVHQKKHSERVKKNEN